LLCVSFPYRRRRKRIPTRESAWSLVAGLAPTAPAADSAAGLARAAMLAGVAAAVLAAALCDTPPPTVAPAGSAAELARANMLGAARRAFATETRKALSIEAWMIVAIVQACCGTNEPAPRRMLGYAMLACFMVVGRFDDLCRLRFDSGFFEDHATYLRFFFDKRKNDQNYSGHWVDVAATDAGSASFPGFSAVAHLRAAAAFLGDEGPVLRRVWKRGATPRLAPPFFAPGTKLAGLQCNMLYKDFVERMRAELVACCGLSAVAAREYSSHGIRAGAATTLVKAQVPDHIIKARAGVVAADWIECYDRVELARRLECSRALGL
jgi:hypothetical protein